MVVGPPQKFRSFACALVASVALFVPASALADDPASKVEELKKRGNQAMMELNYAEALDAYRSAIALAPDDAVLYYNLGRAYQAREEYPDALDALSTFSAKATQDLRARVPRLDELVDDVRTRVATVRITCSADAPNAVVQIGPKATVDGCTRTPKDVRVAVREKRGSIEVRLMDAQLQAEAARVELVGGGPAVAVTLTPVPKASSGRLVVKVAPVEANVSVDGIVRGNPPVEIPLPPGPHVVDVRADRHDDAHVPVVIDVGATRQLDLTLKRSAPITTKWWFWTGVTLAAAGTAVLIWYLVAQPESDAKAGTIDPGVVPVFYRF